MALKSIEEKPKHLRFESQEPREKVYFVLRRHPITNLWWLILTTVLLFIPIVLFIIYEGTNIIPKEAALVFPGGYGLILLIVWYMVTMFFAFESFLMWYFNIYIITDKRVIDIDFSGLWHKRISEASLGNVEDATYSTTGFLHIVFDYGNIAMQTAAENPEFEFNAIPKPAIVHDTLTDLVEAYKQKHD